MKETVTYLCCRDKLLIDRDGKQEIMVKFEMAGMCISYDIITSDKCCSV